MLIDIDSLTKVDFSRAYWPQQVHRNIAIGSCAGFGVAKQY